MSDARRRAEEALAEWSRTPVDGYYPWLPPATRHAIGALYGALRSLLLALDADDRLAKAEKRLRAILDYEPKEVCKDEFAYDRMVEAYREVARRYFAEKGEFNG